MIVLFDPHPNPFPVFGELPTKQRSSSHTETKDTKYSANLFTPGHQLVTQAWSMDCTDLGPEPGANDLKMWDSGECILVESVSNNTA